MAKRVEREAYAGNRRQVQVNDHAYEMYLERCHAGISREQATQMIRRAINESIVARGKVAKTIRERCAANGYKNFMKGIGGWVYWYHPITGLCFVTRAIGPAIYRVLTCFPVRPPCPKRSTPAAKN